MDNTYYHSHISSHTMTYSHIRRLTEPNWSKYLMQWLGIWVCVFLSTMESSLSLIQLTGLYEITPNEKKHVYTVYILCMHNNMLVYSECDHDKLWSINLYTWKSFELLVTINGNKAGLEQNGEMVRSFEIEASEIGQSKPQPRHAWPESARPASVPQWVVLMLPV